MDNSYGYTVKAGKELFVNNSIGECGNSESKFGIYEVGTILKIHTYKNRNTPDYVKLTSEGWESIMVEDLFQDEISEI